MRLALVPFSVRGLSLEHDHEVEVGSASGDGVVVVAAAEGSVFAEGLFVAHELAAVVGGQEGVHQREAAWLFPASPADPSFVFRLNEGGYELLVHRWVFADGPFDVFLIDAGLHGVLARAAEDEETVVEISSREASLHQMVHGSGEGNEKLLHG